MHSVSGHGLVAKRTALVLLAVAVMVGVMATSGATASRDTYSPTVTVVNPPSLVAPTYAASNVTATFSENMRPESINTRTFKLARTNPDGTTTPVAASVAYDAATKTATLDPAADLEPGTYLANVTVGARDAAGNQLDQDPTRTGNQGKHWRFRATDAPAPTDTTPPTVTAFTPAPERGMMSPDVPGTINMTATFSEEMQPESINANTFTLVLQGGSSSGPLPIAGEITYDAASRTATFDPAADLKPGGYDARMRIGARDLAGNLLDQDPNEKGNQGLIWRFIVVSR